MKIINPYKDIDFGTAVRVKGISHEHIFDQTKLKNAWDRGIRWFACVNYFPAVSAAPSLSSWSGTYKIWNYYDVSNAYPTGGIDDSNIYTHETAISKIPVERLNDGLVISYYSTPSLTTYEKLVNGEWIEVSENDLDNQMVLIDRTYSQTISPFIDADGNEIAPDDIPALGNAEHAIFKRSDGTLASMHFNVLGNMFAEACVWEPSYINWYPRAFLTAHPIYLFKDIKQLFTTDLQYTDKYFGTINHSAYVAGIKEYLTTGNGLFKAMEIFNQGFTKEANQQFRDAYDTLLRQGIKLNAVAVADWQGAREIVGYSGQDMSQYVKECTFDRGCNVLYVPDDYDSFTKSQKTEAGLDAYLSGAYYASGLGNYHITDISESNGIIHFSVSGSPSKLKVITSLGSEEYNNTNSVSLNIKPKVTYVRFEAYYYNDSNDMDFIFTNPIWIEDNDNTAAKILLLMD